MEARRPTEEEPEAIDDRPSLIDGAAAPSKRFTTEELRHQLRIDPEKKTVTLDGGYYSQYLRMKRSYRRLADYATGRVLASMDEALDAFYHFLQDAYHSRTGSRTTESPPKRACAERMSRTSSQAARI